VTPRTTSLGYGRSAGHECRSALYSEVLSDERADTAVAFFRRARAWFAAHGIVIRAVLSDNGPCYRSTVFKAELADAGIKHRFTRPYRPTGKVCEYRHRGRREPGSDPGKGLTSCPSFDLSAGGSAPAAQPAGRP